MRGRSSGRPAVSSASPCNADESVWSAVLMAQVWSAVECRHRDRFVTGSWPCGFVVALGTRCRHSPPRTRRWCRARRRPGALPSGLYPASRTVPGRSCSIPTPGWRLGRGHGAPSMAGRHRSRRGAVAAQRLVAASALVLACGPSKRPSGPGGIGCSYIPHSTASWCRRLSVGRVVGPADQSYRGLHATAPLSGRPWYQPEREPPPHDRRRHIAHGSGLADRGDPLLSIHHTNTSGASPLSASHCHPPLMSDSAPPFQLALVEGDTTTAASQDEHPSRDQLISTLIN